MSDFIKQKSVFADKDDLHRHMKRLFPSLPDHIVSLKIECDWSLLEPARITVTYLPPSSPALECSDEDIEPVADVSVPCMFGNGIDGGSADRIIRRQLPPPPALDPGCDYLRDTGRSEASDRLSGLGQVVCSYFTGIKTSLFRAIASLAEHGPVRQPRQPDHSDGDR